VAQCAGAKLGPPLLSASPRDALWRWRCHRLRATGCALAEGAAPCRFSFFSWWRCTVFEAPRRKSAAGAGSALRHRGRVVGSRTNRWRPYGIGACQCRQKQRLDSHV